MRDDGWDDRKEEKGRERGNEVTNGWPGVVAFWHGTERTVSVERAGVGGVGERGGGDAHLVGNCGVAAGERGDGAKNLSAAA